MRVLYLGDIVGRSGRALAVEKIPELRKSLRLDFVVVNGENAAAGFGITEKISDELFTAGVDVISTGNHIWDQKETKNHIAGEKRLIRPLNFPVGTPGRGSTIVQDARGRKMLVINVMGRIFMDPLDDPFAAVEAELNKYALGSTVQFILVDIHGEATSEKMAMGQFCDGRTSLVVGTHSHIPTADAQIFDGGTAYQTDAGMCGDYNSVIGMDKAEPLQRFTRKMSTGRFSPAVGPGTLCGVFVETDDKTGLAKRVEPLRLGARLHEHMPIA
ncbi:TIGR00282 family metallophosphoesterase [Paremcibacter congregatus]|uniref:Metallophosphoesterase n=1 Tax=Paremcibacter congregatus TaxID=2043170 RepID=A0A2G4YTT2_9PROT|nr:TIGR00282 family metallophosphoesterase [Paremcibacter congregatus]PHZ85744.1 metallophosphoesterase [Paremcibacter congregatus]QDE26707.1 YmdB family metallophosphoesterase [Paremcibacter congregatus]